MQVLKLKNKVQHYAWGGFSYIPNLIGADNQNQEPFAELWMGTHNRGESVILHNEHEIPLSEFIAQSPSEILGKPTAEKFNNQLPYLFKILDVNKMLSIQAHPTKKAAEAGFERENKIGIPLTAKHRNYRDDNHKPEIMVAMTDFWLLHGFKSIDGIQQVLNEVPEFAFLKPHFEEKNIKQLYKSIMDLTQEEVNAALEPLRQRLNATENIPKSSADYWAKLGFEQHTNAGNLDKGIFSVYLYNLVNLKKGEAIYQAANVPHAYLEGVNVELMANSDNVFRGGLTVKHVDTNELMQHLIFESVTPEILTGEAITNTETIYPTIAPDFEVAVVRLQPNLTFVSLNPNSCEIAIVLEGTVHVNDMNFKKGESFFIPADVHVNMSSDTNAEIYRAYVPF